MCGCGGPSINARLNNDPPSIGYDRTVWMCGAARPSARHARIQNFSLAHKHGGRGDGQQAVMRLGPILSCLRIAANHHRSSYWRPVSPQDSRVIGPAISTRGRRNSRDPLEGHRIPGATPHESRPQMTCGEIRLGAAGSPIGQRLFACDEHACGGCAEAQIQFLNCLASTLTSSGSERPLRAGISPEAATLKASSCCQLGTA